MTQPNIEVVTDVEEQADWLDGALGILSTADWLTPAMAIARGGASMAVPRAEAAEAAAILRAARIPSWAWQVNGGYIVFDVPQERARDVCRLLGLQYRKPASTWSGRVALVVALGSGALLVWFVFAMMTVGGAL